jgi:microcompartment protein CcmL/EutN
VFAEPTSPGKYLLLFSGPVAEVQESHQAAVEFAGSGVIDQLWLPYAHPMLVQGLEEAFSAEWGESIGVVETHTVAAAILCADAALKEAEVRLMQLHLARGIGGKGYFTLSGSLDMVEAALLAAGKAVSENLLLTTELIQKPHPELRGSVL